MVDELFDPSITHCEELTHGFSGAKKYVLYAGNVPKYVLKVYGMGRAERRKEEFELLQRHVDNQVTCPKPVKFGSNEEHQVCYMILAYLDGTGGDKAIPGRSAEEQYLLGVLAGKELRKIHLVSPSVPFDWYGKRKEKYRRKREECRKAGLTFYRQELIEPYIEDHFHMLKESSVSFQHDDFHPQNMIVNNDGAVSIIDFDSFDWGDPWEEFFKLPKYTIQVSISFARGQINGYFNGIIPETFWPKYNLFVALNQHASQLGGLAYGNLAYVQERTRYIIDTHDFRHNGAPAWFVNE
ncbi:aminoglycoside phosphotransferase family protein [Paenibacillus ginsengarvi]|uniref:Aminoglycoside phosphotransferase family protein n=1 Tax=Paenibacillus ginsengarvi TaxID=400777 RepID=A0A3B0CJK8_9BACL|nr:aminoglycoside phosphotransferase family protein [Paenibacillus ginsengarvi]